MTELLAKIGLDVAFGRLKSELAKIPGWLWITIAVIALLIAGTVWHQRHARAALAAAEKAGEDKAYSNIAAQAAELTTEANTLNAKISTNIRSKTDAENSRVVTQYRTLLVRGPGKAACTSVTGFPASAGGSEPSASQVRDSVDPVPAGGGAELIALPFAGAVAGAGEHDQLLNEDRAWREWYSTFNARWAAWNAAAEKARSKPSK